MPQAKLTRPNSGKGQFSIRQIGLVTLIVAVIMALPMSVADRILYAALASLVVLFADWHVSILQRVDWLMERGYFEAAREKCDTYIERCPRKPDGYIWRGYISIEEGDLDAALDDLETALQLDACSVSAWCGKGSVLFHQEDYAGALTALDNSISYDLEPQPAVYEWRGWTQLMLGNIPAAESDAKLVLEQFESSSIGSLLSNISYIKGDYSETERLQDENAPANFFLDFKLGDYAKAFALAESSCKATIESEEPGDTEQAAQTLLEYGWILATCPNEEFRDSELALLQWERAKVIGHYWFAHSVLAAVHAESGDFEIAVEAAKRALDECPALYRRISTERLSHYQRGEVYLDHGQPVYIEGDEKLYSHNQPSADA